MKFKAIPYIDLKVSNKKYRDFLLQKFEVGNLYLFNNESNVLFVDWRGTDMNGWYKFTNPHCGVTLEFFGDEYKLHIPNKIYAFPIPTTINEFICDCKRAGLDLYWNQYKMDKLFEFKIYINEKESNEYYKDLLTKIEKEDVF
jgi:hypothetical protein